MSLPEHIGRIRINENEARLLVGLLRAHREDVVDERRLALMAGDDAAPFNRTLHHIRKVWQEVSLLAEQKGWNVEPEPDDEEGSRQEVPGRPQEPVGGRPGARERAGGRV